MVNTSFQDLSQAGCACALGPFYLKEAQQQRQGQQQGQQWQVLQQAAGLS
jgi:hypothetical protein